MLIKCETQIFTKCDDCQQRIHNDNDERNKSKVKFRAEFTQLIQTQYIILAYKIIDVTVFILYNKKVSLSVGLLLRSKFNFVDGKSSEQENKTQTFYGQVDERLFHRLSMKI